MAKRQCFGLETFHGHLSVMFPSIRDEGDLATNDRRLPVKFTKNAVELLRETHTEFLRRLGTELSDMDSASHESMVRALSSIFEGDDEGKTNRKRNDLVERAQKLLEQRDQRDREKQQETNNSHGGGKSEKGTTTGAAVNEGKRNVSEFTSPSLEAVTATSQKRKTAGGKGKRKRKPKPKAITAEMEAEQERLLNASKEAFESSQEGQEGGTVSVGFRVQLS